MRTPWGQSDYKREYAEGITFYGTPSHGGFRLSKKVNDTIPQPFRNADGWYEEDCEYAKVHFVYPSLFGDEGAILIDAKRCLKAWFPHEYMQVTSEIVTEDESVILKEENFQKNNADKYLVLSGVGDWKEGVPKGFVLVFAGRGGRLENGHYPDDQKYFLVPDAEYHGHLVIDETRHKETELRF